MLLHTILMIGTEAVGTVLETAVLVAGVLQLTEATMTEVSESMTEGPPSRI